MSDTKTESHDRVASITIDEDDGLAAGLVVVDEETKETVDIAATPKPGRYQLVRVDDDD